MAKVEEKAHTMRPKLLAYETNTAYHDPEAVACSGGTQLMRYNTPEVSDKSSWMCRCLRSGNTLTDPTGANSPWKLIKIAHVKYMNRVVYANVGPKNLSAKMRIKHA